MNNGTRKKTLRFSNNTKKNNTTRTNSQTINWYPESNTIIKVIPNNAKLRSKSTHLNKDYYNRLQELNKYSKSETEEEFIAKKREEYKNALESGYSQENINSQIQNELKDWKKIRPRMERNRLGMLASKQLDVDRELKRRANMQQMSANFAQMVANTTLSNNNNNASYRKKIQNAINRNYNTRRNNIRKKYLDRSLKQMFTNKRHPSVIAQYKNNNN